MKKIVKTLILAASVAVALVSCQKEAQISDLGEKFVMSIQASNPVPVETKTTMVGNDPKWQAGDKVNVLYKKSGDDSWFKATSSALAADAATATFEATLSGADTRTAYAYYPINDLAATSTAAKLTIAADQTPTGTAFDGKSDILVSEGFTPAASVSARFARLGSILRLTIDNDNLDEEKLLNISVEGENPLAGNVSVDLATATSTGIEGGSNEVTATYEAANQFELGSGTDYVYLVVYPQTLAKDSDLIITGETEYYTFGKAITVPSDINLNPGHIVPLTIGITEDPILKVPFVDNMDWANNGSDSNTAYTTSTVNNHYSATEYAYPGKDGLKMGSSSYRGHITTDKMNLSSAFYIEVHAKKYSSDESQLEFYVDGSKVYTSSNLGADYATYYYNSTAATGSSTIDIKIEGKRGYINYIKIGSGEYVAPPAINVTSSNPMDVANTSSSQAITYTITSKPAGTAITNAVADVAWISNIDYSTAGSVTFDVAAQEPAAATRSGNITLSYTGAENVVVVVNQAAGAGGLSQGETKTYSISASTKNDQSFNKLIGNSTNSGNYSHASSKSITLDGDSWTITTAGNGSVIYCGGQQLGAGKSGSTVRDVTSVTMSTSAYTDGIKTITVTSATNGSATLAVYVGGVQVETTKTVGTDVTYTLDTISKGAITLEWSQTTANKNLTIQTITIN